MTPDSELVQKANKELADELEDYKIRQIKYNLTSIEDHRELIKQMEKDIEKIESLTKKPAEPTSGFRIATNTSTG